MARKISPPPKPTGLYFARKFRDMSQDRLADLSGVSKGQISKLERGDGSGRKFTKEWAEKFSPHLEFSAQRLLFWEPPQEPDLPASLTDGDEEPRESVEVVGYVGAGAKATFFPPGRLDEVPAPEGSTANTVAVEIRGTSLGELFDRWLVFYDDVRRPITPDLIGQVCVVGLADERVMIKLVQRGKDGLFDLESNNSKETIRGVAIEWAARVKRMVPR